MIRLLIVVAVLFAVVLEFQWLKGTSGEVALTLHGNVYSVDLSTAVLGLVVALALFAVIVLLLRFLVRIPANSGRRRRWRREERAREALTAGLLAVAAGDVRGAERATGDALRRIPNRPLTMLLRAQTAQLKGDHAEAGEAFKAMLEEPDARIVGLRGLYIEAERQGNHEAARRIAEEARQDASTSPWASRALLRYQAAEGDWAGALELLGSYSRTLDRKAARRQRAVILTAQALDKEIGEPETARNAALEAHELAPELVPAAVVAGRLLSRLGEVRRASKVLEATWKEAPHPEIAEAYAHVRSGDSATDRLKRMETLHRLQPDAPEARIALARAAAEAREWERARTALEPLVKDRPDQRVLILMAEIEEGQSGDRGRAREWLARAVRAPRGPAWTADGVVLEQWAPVSPVTGRLDAVEWKLPLEEPEAVALPDLVQDALGPDQPRQVGRFVEPQGETTGGAERTFEIDGEPVPVDVAIQEEELARAAKSGRTAPDRVTPSPVVTGPTIVAQPVAMRPAAPVSGKTDGPDAVIVDGPKPAPTAQPVIGSGTQPPKLVTPPLPDRPEETLVAEEDLVPPSPDDPGVEEGTAKEPPRRFGLF
ncbi:HemY protein [Faunimonas pinastri]|uniref:HemY protein n=1 Tax=Faunimonas pinastri TaxID=1855383 RepID=A0A1H9IQM5_9HYPH|nr:heme biosynthesis HemY N-terminal domain-containing protein [Faunimonas pinastri]SEQ77081.1 HemY protein [Faunimonas pinastri]